MDTQVVVAKLAATIFIEAESPEAAKAYVEKHFADLDAELAGVKVRIGFEDLEATRAFTEGEDPPGDD